jgi:hypothetical protein
MREMVIGVLFSGIFSGLLAAVGALFMGLPIWSAVLLYPFVGVFGAVAFIGLTLLREKPAHSGVTAEYAVDYR